MGVALHRIKGWVYAFVIVIVGVLVVVRAYNALQRTTYLTQQIEGIGPSAQVSLSYPAKIPGSKIDAYYPLIINFSNYGKLLPAQTYEFVFESPSVLFTDSKGGEVAPRIQITSDYTFIGKSIYIRPLLTEQYPQLHNISMLVLADGQELKIQPASIQIKNEPLWFSYASLFASSILEISVVLGLAGWIIKTLDEAQSSRKETLGKYRDEVQKLSALPVLVRMRKYIDLDKKINGEHLSQDIGDDLQRIKDLFSERDFLRVVGERLRLGKSNELTDVKTLYDYFFIDHKDSILALTKIFGSLPLDQPLFLIADIMKLWDNFDVDAKDLIIAALVHFPNNALSQLSKTELEAKVFCDDNRRRLLRSEEIRQLLPQLVPPPPSYVAKWTQMQERPTDSQKIQDWLKQHDLAENPFSHDIRLCLFYPEGIARPDQWDFFVKSPPCFASCPANEDIYPLAILLRKECLSAWQFFPIFISLQQVDVAQSPLMTLANAAARTWLDILPLSPDAFLDLPLVSQQALLELLFWSVGMKETLINLLQQNGLKEDEAGIVLKRKIAEFDSHIFPAQLLQDQVLLAWLNIRPPELKHTYLILCLDAKLPPLVYAWKEYFGSFIPALFQNKVVTKVVASMPVPFSLSLPEIQLSWSDEQLKKSLESQFEAAINPEEKLMGKSIRFHELFGLGVTEEETTGKLISASHHSLARMLMLGNHLFQKHCKQDVPEKYLSPDELEDILKTV